MLGEYIDHHVKEEEKQMFPQARKAKRDPQALGQQLSERKTELMSELGIADEDVEGEEAETVGAAP